MKVYVASSWRNAHQPDVIAALRASGHDVYDFRHPVESESGFSWSEIDPDWSNWNVHQFLQGIHHDRARHAYRRDRQALDWCDLCVLVLPAGMSAHLEAGWCAGRKKHVVVYAPELREAELMYWLFTSEDRVPLYSSLDDVLLRLSNFDQ